VSWIKLEDSCSTAFSSTILTLYPVSLNDRGNNRSNISFVYSGIIKDRHMKNLKLVAVVLVIAVIAIAVEYTDYIIYKSKYPNTEFWMWLVDDNK
jgi:hypothetical protein